jgi:glutathione synthase/RimK-type ligase-like ATP-grasp enzyme
MRILVLGDAADPHARQIFDTLLQAGVIVDYLDTRSFPTQIHISWQPDEQLGFLTLPNAQRFNLADIHKIFWRNFWMPQIPDLKNSQMQAIAHNDTMSVLRTLLQVKPDRWVNSWMAYQFHKEKALQLSKVKQIGVLIPATLISNDPGKIIEFSRLQAKAIFKPVCGGSHTQLVTPAHLDPERLNAVLKLSPITIQAYISGTNIRSYVIGDSVYSAEIRSHAVDFRTDESAELIPVEIPEYVHQQCLAIRHALMLQWTAIDWRLQPTGEYIFLEANPSPMFIHFENQTGFPIAQELVRLLMS